jgi:uncharacterized protein (TIGR01244 family)
MMQPSYALTVAMAGLIASAVAMTGDASNTATAQVAAVAQAPAKQVPFGDQVGPAISNYNRLRPNIATAGLLKEGAIPKLASLGFATILDLRGPEEGTDAEKRSAEAAGLRYVNIPVPGLLPSDAQVTEFGRIVEDAKNFPLMIHCGSASRVGAMWTLYRVRKSIPLSIALEEGRTIGMQQNREDAVLKRLGRPGR